MITYPDGSQACVADSVVLCGRQYTGVVMHVIDTAEDFKSWNLAEQGLMIDTSFGGLAFIPCRFLEEEEIEFVSRGS